MSTTALERSVLTWTHRHRQETGLRLPPSYFELRVHPDDIYEHLRTVDLGTVSVGQEMAGVPVIVDPTQAVGHPRLRCTWEVVL